MRWWRPSRPEAAIDSGRQPPPLDGELLDLLHERDGGTTTVLLEDGRRLQVLDVAWGYDCGDPYAHVITNISPGSPNLTVDFFFTHQVASVLAEDGAVLYRRRGSARRPASGGVPDRGGDGRHRAYEVTTSSGVPVRLHDVSFVGLAPDQDGRTVLAEFLYDDLFALSVSTRCVVFRAERLVLTLRSATSR